VGGPQISFANRKSTSLRTSKIFYICGFAICGSNIFSNCGFFDLRTQFFCGLKTAANPQILYFSLYKYILQRNSRIFDLRINQNKFTDLKFADSNTSEICWFAIADWAQECVDLRLADSKKTFARPPFLNARWLDS